MIESSKFQLSKFEYFDLLLAVFLLILHACMKGAQLDFLGLSRVVKLHLVSLELRVGVVIYLFIYFFRNAVYNSGIRACSRGYCRGCR